MLLLKQLNKGDIFQDDKHSWDGVFRFHSCQIIDGRLLVKLIGINYQGDVDSCSANSFTWRELNHQAYILYIIGVSLRSLRAYLVFL